MSETVSNQYRFTSSYINKLNKKPFVKLTKNMKQIPFYHSKCSPLEKKNSRFATDHRSKYYQSFSYIHISQLFLIIFYKYKIEQLLSQKKKKKKKQHAYRETAIALIAFEACLMI